MIVRAHRTACSVEPNDRTDPKDYVPICESDPYPQVPPGEYELFCDDVRVYEDPGLKVYKCRYRFVDPANPARRAVYVLGGAPR